MLHRDADSWLRLPPPRPEILASANVALTRFTEENGATVVVPGSHRWPRERKAEPAECARACMPRGAALLYSGEVLHGGGRNDTDELRIGLYVGYLASWLRPIENHLITNGLEAVRAAPEPVRKLLDFTAEGWTPLA
jgi:ectoine hydroxylase-related dioxygenase (phytanoyl-CoA dioxygenase family)